VIDCTGTFSGRALHALRGVFVQADRRGAKHLILIHTHVLKVEEHGRIRVWRGQARYLILAFHMMD
jgi:hypothetical protein